MEGQPIGFWSACLIFVLLLQPVYDAFSAANPASAWLSLMWMHALNVVWYRSLTKNQLLNWARMFVWISLIAEVVDVVYGGYRPLEDMRFMGFYYAAYAICCLVAHMLLAYPHSIAVVLMGANLAGASVTTISKALF